MLFYCRLTDMHMLWVNVLLHKNQPNTVHMQPLMKTAVFALHYATALLGKNAKLATFFL